MQAGIDQPASLNPDAVHKFRQVKPKEMSSEIFLEGILQRNRTILGQAITLIESSLPKHDRLAGQIIEKCLPHSGNSVRIGITGVPGAGKSTFIEAFGVYLTGLGRKVAVLAIDPSSERSKGSILGDKTRMENLSADKNAFIRPSPSAGTLGGVARKTKETIILCEAAGFDTVIIETMGVGQSETAVHNISDFFLLLMLAGAGDELQGIKRGIMELADAIVINKADGDNKNAAKLARQQYENALHLFPPALSGWTTPVLLCSSIRNEGISAVWDTILQYMELTADNGYFKLNRSQQEKKIMYEEILQGLQGNFFANEQVKKMLNENETLIAEGKISSYAAARRVMEAYKGKMGDRI